MPGHRHAGVWWGVLLLIAASCTADTGEKASPSTAPGSATAPTAGTVTTVATTVTTGLSTTAVTARVTSSTTAVPPTTTTPASAANTVATTLPATTTLTTGATTPPATTTTLPDDLTVVEVMVREGKALGEGRVEVPLGNRISMRFDSDAPLLVHVHGYDEEFSVEAGVVSVHEFDGILPGIFEVEDHVTHRPLIELKVTP